jgi:hypothetical protein
MVKSAVIFHQIIKDVFAAVAERAVTDIVRKADGFGEIFIDAESAREGSSDGGHFDGMGQPGPVVVGGAVDKNLRFIFEPAKTAAVQNTVAVALKTGAHRMIRLGI